MFPTEHRSLRSRIASGPRHRPRRGWWTRAISSGSGRGPSQMVRAAILGLYRADGEAELDGLLRALPLYEWMHVTVTPLEPHPNDPGTRTVAPLAAAER